MFAVEFSCSNASWMNCENPVGELYFLITRGNVELGVYLFIACMLVDVKFPSMRALKSFLDASKSADI